MGKVTVVNNLTLDGVMQAPGRPDEDRRGGFAHGGWSWPYQDDVMAKVMGEHMAEGMAGGALLFGWRTYEDFAGFWPHQTDNPFTPVLNAMQKYVVSRVRREPLPWENSTVLTGEATETVAELARRSRQDLTVLGSGELVRSLIRADLVDEYLLSIHPLTLGTGRRMFDDAGPVQRLELIDSVTTTTGVVIATYRPADRTQDTPTPGPRATGTTTREGDR